MRRLRVVMALAALAVACGRDSGTQPQADPGALEIRFTTPHLNDGALMFSVAGGTVDSVTAPDYALFSTAPATTRTMIVAGPLAAGPIARIWVPDRNQSASYSVSLLQVATRGSYTQQPLDGYTLALAKP